MEVGIDFDKYDAIKVEVAGENAHEIEVAESFDEVHVDVKIVKHENRHSYNGHTCAGPRLIFL